MFVFRYFIPAVTRYIHTNIKTYFVVLTTYDNSNDLLQTDFRLTIRTNDFRKTINGIII